MPAPRSTTTPRPDRKSCGTTAGTIATRVSPPGLAADPPPDQLKAFAERSVEVASLQQDALNDIMMAQDFQDLSGQVINKVIKIISRTEKQLLELLVSTTPPPKVETPAVLEGPQTPDKAMKQDDVDDLLASLGF